MWLDVSEPWDLLTVNDALISYEGPPETSPTTVDESAVVAEAAIVGDGVAVHPQAAVLRGVTLGDNVRVGPGAILENTVVLSDAKIGAGVVVTDCIVGANTTVGPNTTVEGGKTDVVLNDRVYHDVTFGGLLGDNVEVGADVTVQPGALIGNGARIDSASLISGRIEDDSYVQRG
jgi:glucose-1-phosphate thymidylyltransferase